MTSLPPTVGYSRSDALNALSGILGEPSSPNELANYTEAHHAAGQFPTAYQGANTKLRDAINNLIISQPQTWHTSVGLPYMENVGMTVEWDELHFDRVLLDRVPFEGTSRLITNHTRRRYERMVRKGIALMMESDFYQTDEGRRRFRDQVQSIRHSVQETLNQDVIYSYLTCENYGHKYNLRRGILSSNNMQKALASQLRNYAIAQKDEKGFDFAVQKCRHAMTRYGVHPDMLIIPDDLGFYMQNVPALKTTYPGGGPDAVAKFNSGAPFEAYDFKGLSVYKHQPIESVGSTASPNLLLRNSQVGEYYVLRAGEPHIVIYDEKHDQFRKVMKKNAALACCIEEVYKFVQANNGTALSYDETLMELFGYDKATWKPVDTDLSAIDISTEAEFKKAIQPAVIEKLANNFDIVIVRPYIEHTTASAVLTVAGNDTGCTLFGIADMQISANTNNKTILGHYTCNTKAVVTKPMNVSVLEDVLCTDYIAGGNAVFFGQEAPCDFEAVVLKSGANIKTSHQKRINDENPEIEYGSLLAFAVPKGTQFDAHLTLGTKMLPWDDAVSPPETKRRPVPREKAWKVYRELFGLDDVKQINGDDSARRAGAFFTDGAVNTLVCKGPHRKPRMNNATPPVPTGDYELITGLGHFGPDAVPGDAAWRRGDHQTAASARMEVSGSYKIQDAFTTLVSRPGMV